MNMNVDLKVSFEDDRRNTIVNRVAQLRKTIDESEEKDYVLNSLCALYESMIDNDQFEDMDATSPIITKKLIRCYRFIPNSYLDYCGVDRIVMGGLFFTTDVCIMPNSMLDSCTRDNKWGAYLHPEKFGLPSTDEVDYITTRPINGQVSSALLKNQWYDGWIDHNYSYEVVTMSLS